MITLLRRAKQPPFLEGMRIHFRNSCRRSLLVKVCTRPKYHEGRQTYHGRPGSLGASPQPPRITGPTGSRQEATQAGGNKPTTQPYSRRIAALPRTTMAMRAHLNTGFILHWSRLLERPWSVFGTAQQRTFVRRPPTTIHTRHTPARPAGRLLAEVFTRITPQSHTEIPYHFVQVMNLSRFLSWSSVSFGDRIDPGFLPYRLRVPFRSLRCYCDLLDALRVILLTYRRLRETCLS